MKNENSQPTNSEYIESNQFAETDEIKVNYISDLILHENIDAFKKLAE